MKIKECATIVSQKEISAGIFDMVLKTPGIAGSAVPGQFVNVYLNNAGKLLPRPISLCGIDAEAGCLRLVYRSNGKGTGTEELSLMKEGDTLELLGPLGNGFPLEEAAGKNVYLIGGGIGVPPLLETAKELNRIAALAESQEEVIRESKADEASDDAQTESDIRVKKTVVTSVMGYRSDRFLLDEFAREGETIVATEDGSFGTKGNVLDAIKADGRLPEVVFACGPTPMLRALKAWALENDIPCWISMEERMACGIGACLACVCKTAEVDGHSHVHNTRVCKDGPVFDARAIDL